MTLPYRQERLLRRADHALRRSDPYLASMLSIFAQLTAADGMPAREQLRPQQIWASRVLLWPVAAVAFLVGALAFLVVFAMRRGLTAAKACGAASRRPGPRASTAPGDADGRSQPASVEEPASNRQSG